MTVPDEPRETTISDRITRRVAAGAALLDRVQPGWAARIAVDRLAMQTCDQCILGQVYGDYFTGFFALIRPLPSHQLFRASDYGFTGKSIRPSEYAELAEVWRDEIRKRLASA